MRSIRSFQRVFCVTMNIMLVPNGGDSKNKRDGIKKLNRKLMQREQILRAQR